MLVLWRRHTQTCPHKDDGREHLKCRCSIWIDWRIAGKRVRKPLHTRDWQAAQMRARQLEADGITSEVVPLTLEQTSKKFLDDATARGLREASLYKYRLVLKQLKAFGDKVGLVFMSSFGVEELRAFRASWPNKNLSAAKKLEHLKAFFRFCHDSGWIKDNPAKVIKPPKVDDPPVLPFSDDEMKKILQACDTHSQPERAVQLRALVLLMRHSGLRIGDACTLSRERIQNGVLELYTAKSGTKVRLPLHPSVLKALNKLPVTAFYFWSGESQRRTCINIWEDTFKKLFQRAGINGHSHRLRHTFAVGLLQSGASMEDVALLLGHRKLAVTEKYYASFTKGRQERLERSVRKSWSGHNSVTSAPSNTK
jgi:site-specific recombinase XerD